MVASSSQSRSNPHGSADADAAPADRLACFDEASATLSPERNGLQYDIARTLDEVLAAWGLVYRSYLRAGLTRPNHEELHTTHYAIAPDTAVVVGRIGPVTASTLSAFVDTPRGLSLDSVYREQLDVLRGEGRRLVEVGLFADRRAQLSRSIDSLFDLMRYSYYYCRYVDADDMLAGVHPHHVRFYCRLIGFDVAGPEVNYATVNDNPVVLLRLDLRTKPLEARLPRGLKYFLDHPVALRDFEPHYAFPAEEVRHSALARFADL